MGIAFDGDFDRCFLFDEKGQFIEGTTSSGCWRKRFWKNTRGEDYPRPAPDPNTEAVVTAAGGTPVMSKTGHAFIKERMRTEDAIYGGEMSAHHYFRDFAYCDSGMIPWLLVAELVCLKGQSLGELVRDRMAAFPASGKSTAGWRSRQRPSRGWKRTSRKRRRRWTARTDSACHSRTGVSTCARRTPNRWCA